MKLNSKFKLCKEIQYKIPEYNYKSPRFRTQLKKQL